MRLREVLRASSIRPDAKAATIIKELAEPIARFASSASQTFCSRSPYPGSSLLSGLVRLIAKPITQLGVDLARIVPVKSTESQTVIKLDAAVRHIDRRYGNRILSQEGFPHR